MKKTPNKKPENTDLELLKSRYATVMESIGEGYYETDTRGNMTFFSNSMVAILGFERGELMGMNYRGYVAPEFVQIVYQAFHQVFTTGETVRNIDWEIITGKGERRIIEASTSPMRDRTGACVGFSGIVRDVTRRKRAEYALKASEERFRILFKLLPIYSMLVDTNMRIVEYNDQFTETWGLLPRGGELHTSDVIHRDDHPRGAKLFIDLYAAGRKVKKEWHEGRISKDECYRALRGITINDEELRFSINGTVHHTSINASLWFDINTLQINGVLATAMDISQIKLLEQKLVESERKYRELVEEKTRDIIFAADRDGRFVTVNTNLKTRLGFSPDDVVGKHLSVILYDDPRDTDGISKQALNDHIARVINGGENDVHFRTDCYHKTLGESVTLQFKLDPIREGKLISGIMGFVSSPSEDQLSTFLVESDVVYEIDSKLSIVTEMCFRLTRDLRKHCDDSEKSLIFIGLRELIINAIEHGNLRITFEEKTKAQMDDSLTELIKTRQAMVENRHKKVYVRCALGPEGVRYVVRDEGPGFDYATYLRRDLSQSKDMFLQHGRGIITARGIFDSIQYNEAGNEITVIRHFRHAGETR